MKKYLNMFALAFVMLVAGVALAACGEVTLKSISVDASSINTVYTVGDEADFSEIVVTASYSDNTTATLGFDDVTLSEFDNTVAGYKTVTVTYQEKTVTISLTYYSSLEDAYTIVGFEQPAFVTNYETNIAEKEDKTTEFANREDGYYVGDDNAFVFLPEITAMNSEQQIVTLNRYVSQSVVSIYENDVWVELTEENLATYVVVDEEQNTYDFTETAIGHEFKLSVVPYFFTDWTPVSFEFSVVDGWNAYNAADLSRLDNASVYNGVNPWADYKAANNVGSEEISALIMHNDIAITANDIPSAFIWQEEELNGLPTSLVGSLKDWISIYVRMNNSGETFNFVGNYFALDASEIPLVERAKNGSMIDEDNGYAIHSTLFGFGGDDNNVPEDNWIGNVIVKNMNLLGNANRSDNQLSSGGLTFFRTSADHFELNNTLARQVLTIMCPFGLWEDGDFANTVLVKDSKGYDAFSTMFYLWGAQMEFVNSEYLNAGGPVMILAHHAYKTNPYAYYSAVTATNSNFGTNVNGEEAWFRYNNANTIATQIAGLLTAFDQYAGAVGSSYRVMTTLNENQVFDLIAVIMASELTDGSYHISGSADFNIDGVVNTTGADLNDEMYQYVYGLTEGQAPILQTSTGNMAYFNGTTFIDVATQNQIASASWFGGDTLTLYYGGMALVLGVQS